MSQPSNDNEVFVVIPIDPKLREVPCVFCLASGRPRSKATHPHHDFWGSEQATICTEHIEEALFAIYNKDRTTLQQWLDSMRQVFLQRATEE